MGQKRLRTAVLDWSVTETCCTSYFR